MGMRKIDLAVLLGVIGYIFLFIASKYGEACILSFLCTHGKASLFGALVLGIMGMFFAIKSEKNSLRNAGIIVTVSLVLFAIGILVLYGLPGTS